MGAIACLHLAAFPLWVRRQLSPDERLLIIHRSGRVIAASAELRTAGLRVGETLDQARLLAPDAAVHPSDPLLEDAMWEDLLHLLHDLSPRLLSLRPGWALLEPSNREGIRRLTGILRARTALAGRRFTAMLGALGAPEGEMLELTSAGARRMLEDSPVGMLAGLGFGQETIERLRLLGLDTLGRIWKLTKLRLEMQLGPDGERLFQLLHPDGEEPSIPEFQPPPAVVISCDCDYPVAEPAELLPALDHLVHRGSGELMGRRAQLIALRLDGGYRAPRIARRVLKGPLSRPYPMYVAAEAMLRALMASTAPVERVTLELGGLSQPEDEGLFPEHPMVYEAVRSLHQRFPGLLM